MNPSLHQIVKHVRRPFSRQTRPGSRPGRVVVDPNAPAPKISVFSFGADGFEVLDPVGVDELTDIVGLRALTWVNVSGLGDADVISRIGEIFEIHPLVLEDLVNVHQRAKVEEYDKQVFVVARMVSMLSSDDGQFVPRLESEQIGIVIGQNYVLTFQERPGDCLDRVRLRIREGRGRIRRSGSDYTAYAILDAIVDGYFPVLEHFGDGLNALEERLETDHGQGTIHRIHQMRSDLLMLRRSAWPHREAVNALMREGVPLVTDETRVYLRDCYDHTVQIIDVTETCRELCADLRDLHFSQVSMRQNEIMKVLTIVASIFIPLSFIAGIYGMNFSSEVSRWNMPELHWAFGYPMALSLMLTVAGGMLFLFRRAGWIGRK